MELTDLQARVWKTIQAMNQSWIEGGNLETLREFFHPDMVAFTASDRLRLDGREACMASWRAFAQKMQVVLWHEDDPKVQVHADGKLGVVTYYYRLVVELEGKQYELAGRDLFVLAEEEGRWWIVANHFSPFPREGQR
jgi:hypothetical protein